MPIKLIYDPRESPYTPYTPRIEYTINEDITTDELAEQMRSFMLAIGHHPKNVDELFTAHAEEEDDDRDKYNNEMAEFLADEKPYIHYAAEEDEQWEYNDEEMLTAKNNKGADADD